MEAAEIKTHVRKYYSGLFEGKLRSRIPVLSGKRLAEALHYPVDLLSSVPDEYWNSFAPCGNPLPYLSVAGGNRILNLGCGAGIDSFALMKVFRLPITIINLDVVPSVLQKARLIENDFNHSEHTVEWICSDAEALPTVGEAFNWVIMNGVFNLLPDKRRVLEEVHRVLAPSGSLVLADLCRSGPLPDHFQSEKDAWAWCMSGACTERELFSLMRGAGFAQARLVREENEDMFYRVSLICRKGEGG